MYLCVSLGELLHLRLIFSFGWEIRTWIFWVFNFEQRTLRATKMIQGTEHFSDDRFKSWGCSAWRELRGDLRAAFRYLNRGCKKEGDRLFSRLCCDRTREMVSYLKRGAFNPLQWGWWGTGAGCPEKWDALSLETLKVRLDQALSNLI